MWFPFSVTSSGEIAKASAAAAAAATQGRDYWLTDKKPL